MGNVPISCCRSKSPRPDSESRGSESNAQYSRSKKLSSKYVTEECDPASLQQSNQNILQHISEREPDDSDTDPSSNPLNRPIFAQRSSSSKNQQCRLSNAYDSYSSNNSASVMRKQTLTPLTSSQDQGYTSGASTNLTHSDGAGVGHLTSSFDTNSVHPINNQQQVSSNLSDQLNGLNVSQDTSPGDSRHLQSSTSCDDEVNRTLPCYSKRFYLSNRRSPDVDADERLPIGDDNRYKASSCSTIFIDSSTISQPDLDQTIKCVSLAIYYHIRNRSSDEVSEIFDETLHPLRIPANPIQLTKNSPPSHQLQEATNQTEELITLETDNQITRSNTGDQITEPNQGIIYTFVKTLFKAAQLTSEYAITTLVYLERLMTYAEIDLAPKSWRRIFLGAILLSSKVWEDQAIWNVDYAQILEGISVDDINELERQFLELIQFNMNVPSSVYAKYYFHLRTLALKNGLTDEQTLLTTGKAKALEVSFH